MPGGIPVATFAIGKPGAVNAALFAVAILAAKRPELQKRLVEFRAEQAAKVLKETLP
jgi:5-(carboxyamino)imidazole ribonucleotide mutase